METVLLETKLRPPPMRAGLVSRPRLTKLLDQGLEARLTLVSAPAGYGKTTLVRNWVEILRDRGVPAAWVSLDERDDEPTRFWMYVATAFEAIQPGIADAVVSALGTRDLLPSDLQRLSTFATWEWLHLEGGSSRRMAGCLT